MGESIQEESPLFSTLSLTSAPIDAKKQALSSVPSPLEASIHQTTSRQLGCLQQVAGNICE